MYYGMTYNGLGKPDSALLYLQKTEAAYNIRPDISGYAQALGEFAKAYELKGDTELADVYYKKALKFCTDKQTLPFTLVIGNKYANYLLKQGNYNEAGKLAANNIVIAKNANNFNGIALTAEILQKVYAYKGNKDSAYQYAIIQIAYKDTISNQKRVNEFQNLTFSQKLKNIDEESKIKETEEQRKQNIQFALIAFGIITFIIIFLLLSRSIITNTKMIEFLGVIALLIVFEFLNLLLHPFLERVTNHSPVLMLLALV
jgi:tetratricopeptide (TPR) repeat protein